VKQINNPEVVVIAGASAGVGRAIAQAFGRRGAHIGLLARGHAGLEGAKRDVEAAGGKAITIPTDVADPDQVEAAATQVENTFGPIDVWIQVAMVSVFSPAKEMKPEEYKRVTEVTYLGQVYGTLAALHRMLPRDKGKIILIGSALGYRGIPLQSAYCGAKHAIEGFSQSVRTELMHDKSNVKLSVVQLPAVNTPQFRWEKSRLAHKAQPVPPIFQPEVIADAVCYITDHYRREIFVGSSTVKAIEGNKIDPWYAASYLAKTGYKSQQTSEPRDPNEPYNLWEPVDENKDYGAHGVFDDRARSWSWQLWANTHRPILALAGAGLLGVLTTALVKKVR
jgi:short-subunit dehydrogenase